ncbi:DUF6320 domain-containing protein [Roseburia sp. 831b]|uniref:DUF6320 domain-containing protein n=1 Tax=Roseburia sp. 831b TaxID=1261635 RepID=UPI0009511CDB|nr:DUF6320 domain-containing protein [Roseburia sp. 831b]WVK71837.1 DUF6320 domain-containing protein [Roseburia sp. 831b]
MSRCNKCNIEVIDETERCPLCNCVLEQTVEVENMYPNVRLKARKMMLFGRIYLFLAILTEALLLYINYVTAPKMWWSVITGMIFLYGYLLIRFAILGRTGYRIKIVVLMMIMILMMVAIDFVVGYHGWSLNYVLPSGIIAVDVGILLLMLINRRNWQSYMMLQIFMMVCSVVPVIFAAVGLVTAPLLSQIALAFSVFLFLGTVIIGDRRARTELRRRFHVR